MSSLWFTNNRVLQHKLGGSCGIKHYDVLSWGFDQDARVAVDCFPKSILLNLNALVQLRVGSRTNFNNQGFPQLHQGILSRLSPTLRFIEFQFVDAEECWLRTEPRTSTWDEATSKRTPFDFGSHFPSLQALILAAPSTRSCPRTHMEFITTFAHLTSADLQTLPESVTVLEIPYNTIVLPEWHHTVSRLRCSTNLERLSLGHFEKMIYSNDSIIFSEFSSLSTLDLRLVERFPHEYIQLLPRTLNLLVLNMDSFPSESIMLLPPRLETLSLTFLKGYGIHQDDLSHLPQSLTDLRYCAKHHSTGWLCLLPPRLSYLQIRNMALDLFDCFSEVRQPLDKIILIDTVYKLPFPVEQLLTKRLLRWGTLKELVSRSDLVNLRPLLDHHAKEQILKDLFFYSIECNSFDALQYILSICAVGTNKVALDNGITHARQHGHTAIELFLQAINYSVEQQSL
jgi:hypothetical protein